MWLVMPRSTVCITSIIMFSRRRPLTSRSNTGMGYASLITNTTGTNNTAHGHNSLYANTTSSNNTGLGTNALVANTIGSANTAVGSGALDTNTIGATNTAVGYLSSFTNLNLQNKAIMSNVGSQRENPYLIKTPSGEEDIRWLLK